MGTDGGALTTGGFDFETDAGTLAGGFAFGTDRDTLTAGAFDFGTAGGGAVATRGGAGFGGAGVTTGGDVFDAGAFGGALTAPPASGDCAGALEVGAAERGGVTGALTMGGRTGGFCATVAAGVRGAGAGDCGVRNHATSAMSRMTSIAARTIERLRRGLSDLYPSAASTASAWAVRPGLAASAGSGPRRSAS